MLGRGTSACGREDDLHLLYLVKPHALTRAILQLSGGRCIDQGSQQVHRERKRMHNESGGRGTRAGAARARGISDKLKHSRQEP